MMSLTLLNPALLVVITTSSVCPLLWVGILTHCIRSKASIEYCTGGSCLSWIFWEHENQSGLLVIRLIYIKLYRKKETKFWKKIWAKWESSLTAVQLKQDPPVICMHSGC